MAWKLRRRKKSPILLVLSPESVCTNCMGHGNHLVRILYYCFLLAEDVLVHQHGCYVLVLNIFILCLSSPSLSPSLSPFLFFLPPSLYPSIPFSPFHTSLPPSLPPSLSPFLLFSYIPPSWGPLCVLKFDDSLWSFCYLVYNV